jgi:hypothetical protein
MRRPVALRAPLPADLLTGLVKMARQRLPVDWNVEIVSGAGSLAVEIRLYDTRGRAIIANCRVERGATYEAYRQFADLMFAALARGAPQFSGRLAWGGKFTDTAGLWRVAHFDLAGFRGRGRYRPRSIG